MRSILHGLFSLLVLLAIIALIGRLLLFRVVYTDSYAMLPNIAPGDYFLVLTRAKLELGDAVVCKRPDDPTTLFVGRIVGTEELTVELDHNELIIEGETRRKEAEGTLVYEDRTSGTPLQIELDVVRELLGGSAYRVGIQERGANSSMRPFTVSDSSAFLLGDNRNHGQDSREYGEVALDDCIGKAFLVVWPGPDNGDLRTHDRFFSWID